MDYHLHSRLNLCFGDGACGEESSDVIDFEVSNVGTSEPHEVGRILRDLVTWAEENDSARAENRFPIRPSSSTEASLDDMWPSEWFSTLAGGDMGGDTPLPGRGIVLYSGL